MNTTFLSESIRSLFSFSSCIIIIFSSSWLIWFSYSRCLIGFDGHTYSNRLFNTRISPHGGPVICGLDGASGALNNLGVSFVDWGLILSILLVEADSQPSTVDDCADGKDKLLKLDDLCGARIPASQSLVISKNLLFVVGFGTLAGCCSIESIGIDVDVGLVGIIVILLLDSFGFLFIFLVEGCVSASTVIDSKSAVDKALALR